MSEQEIIRNMRNETIEDMHGKNESTWSQILNQDQPYKVKWRECEECGKEIKEGERYYHLMEYKSHSWLSRREYDWYFSEYYHPECFEKRFYRILSEKFKKSKKKSKKNRGE